MPDVRIDVYADTHGAPATLGATEKALDGLEKGSGVASGTMGGLWKQFAIGQLAVEGLKKGYGLLKDFVEGSIKAAIDAEDAENNLNAALVITGRNVPVLSQHFKDYSSALQKQTVYNDEAIMGAQALLLQLTNLDREGIDRATKGSIGLASVMKIDLQSAATMVTKAMEGNYGALGRVGIRVAENLTGAQKQASLLEQLGKLYQRAEAETDTFGGSIKQLNNSWNDMTEVVGGAVTKNEAFRGAIKDLQEWVDKIAKSPDFQLWLNTVIDGMVAAAKFTGKFAGACRDLMMNVFGATKADREMTEAQIKLNAALDRARAAGHDVDQVARAIAAAHAAATPKINETGTAVHGLTAEQIKAAAEAKKMKDELTKAAQAIIDKYNPLGAAVRKYIDDERELTKAYAAHLITEGQYRSGMDAIEKAVRGTADAISTTFTPAARNMNLIMAAAPGVLDDTRDAADNLDLVFKAIGDTMGVSAATVKVAMWNMQADILAAYGIIIAKIPEFPATAKTATAQTKSFFDGLWSDVAQGFGSTLQTWLSGTTTFRDFAKGAWGDIKNAIFAAIGQGTTKLLMNLFDSVISKTKDVGDAISKNISGVLGGAGAAAGQVASSFLSAAGSIASIVTAVASVVSLLKSPPTGAADGMGRVVERQDQQTAILGSIIEFLRVNMSNGIQDIGKCMESLKTISSSNYLKSVVGYLKDIANTIGKLKGAQSGAISTQTQLMIVHGTPSNPEYVLKASQLAGLAGVGGGGKNQGYGANKPTIIQNHIYIDGREMKIFITRTIEEAGQLGRLRMAGKAIS